ncbi:roadblock/LC7 domain-containing protein, partial [candidate division WOR-3 bacterium]|nr:roadblock/LC7 domain-containing protein [candidate division WOR-3 bacterium]
RDKGFQYRYDSIGSKTIERGNGGLFMIKEYLESLNEMEYVKGVILSDRDGIIIESLMSTELNKELLAAMAAKVASNIENNISQLEEKLNSQCIIFTDEVNIFFSIMSDVILILLTDTKANIGGIKLNMRKYVDLIRDELSG